MRKTHHVSTRKYEQYFKKKNATFKISVNCISHIDLKCRLKYFQAIFKAWIELA